MAKKIERRFTVGDGERYTDRVDGNIINPPPEVEGEVAALRVDATYAELEFKIAALATELAKAIVVKKQAMAEGFTGLRQKLSAIDGEMRGKGFDVVVPDNMIMLQGSPQNQEEAAMPAENFTRGQLAQALRAVRERSFYEGFQLAGAAFMTHKKEIFGGDE